MKRRLEDKEQIEGQQTERGEEEEAERTVEEEGEMKETKNTTQTKEMKKQTEKRKIIALKMNEMKDRREIEGVILKPEKDCR